MLGAMVRRGKAGTRKDEVDKRPGPPDVVKPPAMTKPLRR